MKLFIRPEKENEFPSIYTLIQVAFETADVADGDEQDFANNLRASENYIPELALVATTDNETLAGHIMFTRMIIQTDSTAIPALLIAPLAIAQEYRGMGVGGALIEEGMRRGRTMGYGSVFLCGDPNYYHRFGFQSAIDFGIRHSSELDDRYVMCKELVDGALSGISGSISVF